MMQVTSAAVALVLISGCTVGPRYAGPPELNLVSYHTYAPSAESKKDLRATPLDKWWSGFQDPALSRIVQRALDQNLDLAAAMAQVTRSRAVAREAGARELPTGEAEGMVSPLRQSLNSPIGTVARHLPGYVRDQTLYDDDVGVRWEIDLFGGLRRGREAATDEAQAAEAQRLGVRISVAADVADAYFQIRGN